MEDVQGNAEAKRVNKATDTHASIKMMARMSRKTEPWLLRSMASLSLLLAAAEVCCSLTQPSSIYAIANIPLPQLDRSSDALTIHSFKRVVWFA
ncbi:uncharacterized protein UTRI_04556 [Ustilago trichophora]|uniref:Uncharacterized protein n=1 Tax=Ustilago trichophora TaxID=86804 RepID=A0A5C3EE02_9BASI|nr:uncharacterized protein UTRI_04556 [Ustilago trichophora]